MIEEEYPISIEDLKNKFQKWFGKPVPADPSYPVEVEHSMGRPVPVDLPLPAKAEHSMGRPVPVNLSIPVATVPLKLETRGRQADNTQKFLELLNLGFTGAVLSGAVVGAIIFLLNLGFPGWYSVYWPNQFILIFLAILLGFNIGLSKGYVAQQREKYFYKGEF